MVKADVRISRLYRAKVVKALGKNLHDELEWVNMISLKHLKNYQIWYGTNHPSRSRAGTLMTYPSTGITAK